MTIGKMHMIVQTRSEQDVGHADPIVVDVDRVTETKQNNNNKQRVTTMMIKIMFIYDTNNKIVIDFKENDLLILFIYLLFYLKLRDTCNKSSLKTMIIGRH